MADSQSTPHLTYEQLGEEANNFDLESLKQATTPAADAKSLAIDPSAICKAYNLFKPVLEILSNLFFIPQKYRDAIKTFMGFMNGICA